MTFSLHKLVGLPAIAAAAFFMQALDATIPVSYTHLTLPTILLV